MKNLKQLTADYTKSFNTICKKIEKYGMDDYFDKYCEIKEVCFELSIDVQEIENTFIK
tara:strand:- start:172 stop:345 length:174 start_codon:yes stop_codon:yes gene_type:complete